MAATIDPGAGCATAVRGADVVCSAAAVANMRTVAAAAAALKRFIALSRFALAMDQTREARAARTGLFAVSAMVCVDGGDEGSMREEAARVHAC
jgi:hypothetical protein